MGEVKRVISEDCGIARKPIATRNPQANSMVERAHQTVHNMIRSQQLHRRNPDPGERPFEGIVAAVGFAMRATVHTTLQATPAQLVFGRDQILPVTFKADWQYIKQRKQRLIEQNNARENKKRKHYECAEGDQVVIAQK